VVAAEGAAVVAALMLLAGGATAHAQVDPNIYVNVTSKQD
jgi:hypothetical protein